MIDIATTEYDVELIDEKGVRYLINDGLVNLEWEEQDSELAQRANITLANMLIGSTQLAAVAKLNCIILIYAKWTNAPKTLLFEGTIWEWNPVTSSTKKDFTITAYDKLIRLQQSQDFKFYSAGMNTRDIIADICNTWGIPFNYKWGRSITHEKKVFNRDTVSGMIISLLEEVRKKTGEKYVVYWRNNALQISGYGTNGTVYKFENEKTISVANKLTLNNLVTRVKIIGKADDEGRAPVDAVIDGDTRFGVLQAVIQNYDSKSLADLTAEAQTLIKERGKPEEYIPVILPDLPFLRKGDKIEMAAGNLTGFFNVLSVSHNAAQKQMSLTLDRTNTRPSPSQEDIGGAAGNAGTFARGDAIILNGPVFVDSFGNGRGRTFENYRSTITIAAPLSRVAPYHIGAVGWARPSDITRG
jgi:hypothetical protein